MYFSALPVPVKAQASIFHNQAVDEPLEGMWVSLAKLSMEVEQLQKWSPTEFLALFSEEFGAFHRLRLEKKESSLQQLLCNVLTSSEPLF